MIIKSNGKFILKILFMLPSLTDSDYLTETVAKRRVYRLFDFKSLERHKVDCVSRCKSRCFRDSNWKNFYESCVSQKFQKDK